MRVWFGFAGRGQCLPQLNAASFPHRRAAVRRALLVEYGLEIGAGLGALAGKVWRIGLMGYASNRKNVNLCVSALGNVLNAQGHRCDVSQAIAEVERVYV